MNKTFNEIDLLYIYLLLLLSFLPLALDPELHALTCTALGLKVRW